MELQASKAALLEQAHAASTSPGVYLMKDATGGLLYVGKAKNLKNRLCTYFQPAPAENPRTEMMVARVHHFDVILTETEAEALILECTLIKKHKPKFNVRLKDDKAYPYLRIQVNDRFPRLEYVRRVQRDGARYFGPFPSGWAARQVMTLLTETYQLRDCSDNTFRHRSRPCILFQMGKCTGSCVGKIDEPHYRESINEVIGILEGRSTEKMIGVLRNQMEEAAEQEQYEVAAQFRDEIRNLELVTQTQGVVEAGAHRDRDVLGLARKGADAHGTVLKIRGGRMIAVQHYVLNNTDPAISDEQVLTDFLSQYYVQLEQAKEKAESEDVYEKGEARAQEVLVPVAPLEAELLERTLGVRLRTVEPEPAGSGTAEPRSGGMSLRAAMQGQGTTEEAVARQLLNVAHSNAEYALEQTIAKASAAGGHGLEALEDIQDKLHLSKLPHRIECFDNSNIQGEDPVASRVVFIDGAPDKNLYRRYKVKTVVGANDFAIMKEILGRRFAHDESLPDLVVVDGGKGQLAQAVAILEELQVQGVAVVGLAKARTERDFKAKEVKSSMERIFIPGRKNPVNLLPHTAAYRLLTHVRDEAHRFAITYHRVRRSKRVFGEKS